MTLSADLPGFICGIQAGAADVVHDRRINADKIDIKKGTDGIQMHRCAHFRQLTDNHALRAALFNNARASRVIACALERSLIPISTTPFPIGMISPPSKVWRPGGVSTSPHHTLTAPAKRG